MTHLPKLPLEPMSNRVYQMAEESAGKDLYPAAKRIFDVVVSAVLIVALSPLLLMIWAIVYKKIGGNAIFKHKREGRHGRSFQCMKFRSMVLDAQERLDHILATDPEAKAEWDLNQKLKDDPRIIDGIGHFLRKSSLDELPQLFNVFKGEMSMVGPRPVVLKEMEHYGDKAYLYYSVRPGLTGPWQVGERSDCDYETRVAQDVEYVKNWTLLGDVKIILQTVAMVLRLRKSKGAY